MRTALVPTATRSPSPDAGRSRPTVSPLRTARRSRVADTRSAAERSADRTRTDPTRADTPARASRVAAPTTTRPAVPRRSTSRDARPPGVVSPAGADLRERGLLVAAAAALFAVLALAVLPGVPAGAAIAMGFVPSLAGGWLALTLLPRADGGTAPGPPQAIVVLLAAHAVAIVPVGAAILITG